MRCIMPKSYAEAVDALKGYIKREKLSDIVAVKDEPSELIIKISKLGTSTLTFAVTEKDGTTEFLLIKENIAFSHKAYKSKIIKYVTDMVEQEGGSVVA